MDNKLRKFEEIFAGLRNRDDRVQERIYVYFWGYLMGVSTRYFKDRNVAREVVNDSFIKAFKLMYDFERDSNIDDFHKTFRSWLARITVRTAIDKLRAEKTLVDYVDVYQEVKIEHVDVEQKLYVEDIMKLLFKLPDLHRMVFNLYEIEGFSHDEIATMLSIPVSSSRTYLTRAKHKLRELYTKSIQIN